MYRFLCEHDFSFLWDKYPRVGMFVFNKLIAFIYNQDVSATNPCSQLLLNKQSSGNVGQQGLMILVGQSASVPQSPLVLLCIIYLLARLLVCQLKWAEWEHDGLYLDF